MAKRVHVSSAVLIGSLLHAGAASALGLGDITLKSYLNEPLNAEVRLIDTRDLVADEIKVRLAGVDDFERLGVDRSYFLTRIQFEVSIDRESNTGVIRLTTNEPVLEPFVDVIIEARWPAGRLLREYTVLVDPPVFREEPLVVSASEEVAAAEAEAEAEAARAAGESAAEPGPESGSDAAGSRESQARPGRGDRVATPRSDLPAGEMPQRGFSAETSEAPVAGQRYMVRRDETLWQIASRGRPEGSSVQQAMLDIQRLNPEAFIEGNINRIKAGYIIYLPAQGDISSDDLAEALAEVQQQNTDWESRRAGTPGVTAAASLRISADPAEPDAALDELEDGDAAQEVADSGSGGFADEPAARPSAMQGEASPGSDPADRSVAADPVADGELARSELADQLAAMSGRLDTLEQIVAVKDEQIATLEQALREARAASAQAPAPVAAPTADRVDSAAAGSSAPAGSDAANTAGFGPWLYAAVGVLLAALLGLLFWRRRRDADTSDEDVLVAGTARSDDAEDVFAGVKLRDEPTVAEKPPTEPVQPTESRPDSPDTSPPRNNRGYGERRYDDYIDDAGGGDALAEADIYIAYGRYLQAAELLNTAIEGEPDNVAYRLKLIELYVDMGEPEQAREQVDALRGLGDHDAVRRGEAIVGGTAAPAQQESAPKAAPAPAPEPEPEPEPEPDTTASGFSLASDLEPLDDSDSREFDRPVALTPRETAAAPPASFTSPQPVPGAQTTAAARNESESVDDTQYVLPDETDYEPLEFSLDEVSAGEEVPKGSGIAGGVTDTHVARGKTDDDEPLELELDFDELAIEDDEPAAVADVEDDELDLSDALREADAPPEYSLDDAGSDERDSEDMVYAADADQVATRLDLARAYLDMGDEDGARRILEQVMSAGSEAQRREAETLLDRIG